MNTIDKKRNNEQNDSLNNKKNKVVDGGNEKDNDHNEELQLREILFFKVFRNKTIYKHIMSFMNNFRNDQPYQYIISVKEMLNNNQIELLKCKVKRNEHLSFNDTSLSPISTWMKLLSTIQDDKEFYFNLFKNYKDYIPLRDCIDDKFERITNYICETNCLIALKVLIVEFNFQPSLFNLQIAFKYCRYEIIKLIQQTIGEQSLNKIKSNELYMYFPNLTPTKSLVEIVSKLFKKGYTKSYYKFTFDEKTNQVEECIKCWKFFIELFKPTKQILLKFFNNESLVLFNNVNPLYFKLKHLIQIISILDLLDIWEIFDILNCKYPQLWLKKDKFNLFQRGIESFFICDGISNLKSKIKDQINLCEFTEQQLNSNLNDSINYLSGNCEIIKMLLHVFYCINDGTLDDEYFSEFYICYGGNNIIGNLINNVNSIEFNILNSFDHAHYPTFINWLKLRKEGISELEHALIYSNKSIKPFSKCSTNKELQIKFINSIINDIKRKYQYSLHYWLFFLMLVNFGNVELVKYYADGIGPGLTFPENDYGNSFSTYIRTPEMMEFIFNNFYDWIDKPTSKIIIMNTNNLNVLKCFEQLYFTKLSQIQNQLLVPKKIYLNEGSTTVSFVKHILKDLSIYNHYERLFDYRPIDFNELNHKEQEDYFSLLKKAIQTMPYEKIPSKFNPLVFFKLLKFNYYPSKSIVKYLIWFFNSSYFQIYKEVIQDEWTFWVSQDNSSLILIKYFLIGNGEYDETNQLLENVSWSSIINKFDYTEIIRFSISRGDLKTLDRILNILLSSLSSITQLELKSIKDFILKNILKVIVYEEQILILYHLYSNFNQLFKIGSIYTEKELTDFTIISLQSFNYKINDFFLNLYPISKENLESIKIISPHSYEHYKLKF